MAHSLRAYFLDPRYHLHSGHLLHVVGMQNEVRRRRTKVNQHGQPTETLRREDERRNIDPLIRSRAKIKGGNPCKSL